MFPQGDRFFMYNDLAYRQDDLPVLEQTRAVGHAVRATYLFSAMTDVATMLGDTPLAKMTDLLFTDVTSKRVYITGGLGSVGSTEAFGPDYSLPNLSAYTETCASIGGMLVVGALYLLVNFAYFYAMTPDQIAEIKRRLADDDVATADEVVAFFRHRTI